MDKRGFLYLSVLAVLFAGCSADVASPDAASNDFAAQESALKVRNFGEIGGSPWGDNASMQLQAKAPAANMNYGRALAVGYINSDSVPDIVSSQGAMVQTGSVDVRYGNSGTYSYVLSPKFSNENYGAALAVGRFCPEIAPYDMIIASAPTYYSSFRGAFGIIYSTDGTIRNTKTRKILYGTKNFDLMGTALTVADIDNDGNVDLIYQSTPIDSDTYEYKNTTVSVVMNLCSLISTADGIQLTPDFVLTGETQGFGNKIFVADLDQSGTPELVVVDNLYHTESVEGAPEGAIHFYHIIDGALVESRPSIIGDTGSSIETVAFSDLDGDGDLDLLVGEPMHQTTKKREGRVRSYTNPGAGMPFDDGAPLWSAVSDRSHARFGSEVIVADVNQDGFDDLIVGAPGFRTSGSERSNAFIYVYMGTSDGSIFSHEPYWTYASTVPMEINDDFGRNIAVAQLDKASWLDLIVAAPNASTSTSSVDDMGRIDVFHASENLCYTADKCLIGNICYEAGEGLDGDKCTYCDPEQNNFGWQHVICDPSTEACVENACVDGTCVLRNVKNGTACDDFSCQNNALSTYTCQEGVCTHEEISCGNYRCSHDSVLACMTSCSSDSDCYIGLCDSGECTISDDGRPIIILADYPDTVTTGTEIELDASASYDPDGGEVWFSWWSSDVAWDLIDSSTTSAIRLTAPDEPGIFSMHVLVTDDEGLSTQRDITFEAIEPVVPEETPEMIVKSPARGAVMSADSSVAVSGDTNPNTPVSVVIRSDDGNAYEASCSTVSDETGAWECILSDGAMVFPAGDYTITATSTINGVPVSYDVNVHLTEPLATDENGKLETAGCSISQSTSHGWALAFLGLMIGLVPLRRRIRA
ncbi:MAG: VCBS repeat-containing protein [Proteobacteria bacterium]|nr:VCBS repeat-containing protein [Pseudomonadota bacterium]